MYFSNVYYNDASCEPSKTLQRLEAQGLKNFIPIDCMGILAVSTKRPTIVGELNYKQICLQKIIDQFDTGDLFSLDAPRSYPISYDGTAIHFVIVPLRSENKLKVFFIAANYDHAYTAEQLAILSTIMKITREIAFLNNEIIHEENYLANILDSSEAIIISTNLNSEIATANKVALKFWGTGEIIGNNISALFKYDFSEHIAQVTSTNRSVSLKDTVITKNRKKKHIMNITISPLQNSKEKNVGFVFIATDVTATKILQNQVEQLREFAALGEIAAEVAHDIKNPLMTIRGCSKIIEKELQHDHKCIKFINPIIEEVERINEVVEQMLSYRHITDEINSIININELLEKSVVITHFHTGQKNIVFHKELAPDLPLIYGHNVKLQQAFINILSNALQAIDTDGVITIQSKHIDHTVLVSIIDNGVGIRAKEIKKIFQPYYTTKQPTRGLGLSIVNRVIQEHGGKIVVNSTLHKGTAFHVYLPCRRND